MSKTLERMAQGKQQPKFERNPCIRLREICQGRTDGQTTDKSPIPWPLLTESSRANYWTDSQSWQKSEILWARINFCVAAVIMLDVCAGKYSNALKRLGSYFTRSRHFRGLLFAGTYLIMAAQLSMFDFVKIYFSRKDLKEQLMFHQSQTRKKNISLQLTTAA